MKNIHWGQFVTRHRISKHMTMSMLAKKAGCDGSYITLIERHGYIPSQEKVVALAKALDVDPTEMLIEARYLAIADASGPYWEHLLGKNVDKLLIPELISSINKLAGLTHSQQIKVSEMLDAYMEAIVIGARRRRNYAKNNR